jgi:hypothetical protein
MGIAASNGIISGIALASQDIFSEEFTINPTYLGIHHSNSASETTDLCDLGTAPMIGEVFGCNFAANPGGADSPACRELISGHLTQRNLDSADHFVLYRKRDTHRH